MDEYDDVPYVVVYYFKRTTTREFIRISVWHLAWELSATYVVRIGPTEIQIQIAVVLFGYLRLSARTRVIVESDNIEEWNC